MRSSFSVVTVAYRRYTYLSSLTNPSCTLSIRVPPASDRYHSDVTKCYEYYFGEWIPYLSSRRCDRGDNVGP